MWSICNEVLCEGFNASSAVILKKIIEELDPQGNRPVSAAMNGGLGSQFSDALDVVGINYQIGQYENFHKSHMQQPVIGSETASALSDRGVYFTSSTVKCVSAYDVNAPGWGNSAESAMQAVWVNDFMAGGVVWTGFDYKGEPTPYDWPNINSHFGVIDIAGFPKDAFYYYKSIWHSDVTVHLFPHWNWASGDTVNMWVYTNADQVQLNLNGKNLGMKTVPSSKTAMGRVWRSHVEWNVPFEAGNITATGYDSNGKVIGMDVLTTTSAAYGLHLSVEFPKTSILRADGLDVALVTCAVVDMQGNVIPTAANIVRISVAGKSGQIIGLGNGNPNDHEADKPLSGQTGLRSAFNGLLRAVIQSSTSAGDITVMAQSSNLQTDTIVIKVQ